MRTRVRIDTLNDSVSLGPSHHQDRTRYTAHNRSAHTSQQHALDRTESAAAHYDEVRAQLRRSSADDLGPNTELDLVHEWHTASHRLGGRPNQHATV
jgi:hypothetical protein